MDMQTFGALLGAVKKIPGTAVQEAVAAAASAEASAESAEESAAYALLHMDELNDTTQKITFNDSGNVQQIVHEAGGTAKRTDAFTYSGNTITEVRTLDSGESLTIATNTDTLESVVTYAGA